MLLEHPLQSRCLLKKETPSLSVLEVEVLDCIVLSCSPAALWVLLAPYLTQEKPLC